MLENDPFQLTNGTCSVRGCRQDPILCANHQRFGLIAVCEDHNPIKHGMSRELPTGILIRVKVAPIPQDNKPQMAGGSKVPRTPKPVLPVAPTMACVDPF
jgi:hypothetical protein